MLKTSAHFPYPGSEALLGDRKVKIISIGRDGSRFVTAKGIARTVALDALSDAVVGDNPFDRWLAERSEETAPDAIGTPTIDLYDDYRAWMSARGCASNEIPTHIAFSRMLGANGLVATLRRVDGRNHRCVARALKQPVAA